MRRRISGRIASLSVASCLALLSANLQALGRDLSSAARNLGWERQTFSEFGMSFDFPSHVFSAQSAQVRDSGVIYYTPDRRARVGVFGFLKNGQDTPRELLNKIADFRAGNFTYVRTTGRFFAASGTRGGSIFYRRCNLRQPGDRRVGCLYIDYPRAEKRMWDPVVTRMSLSLHVTR